MTERSKTDAEIDEIVKHINEVVEKVSSGEMTEEEANADGQFFETLTMEDAIEVMKRLANDSDMPSGATVSLVGEDTQESDTFIIIAKMKAQMAAVTTLINSGVEFDGSQRLAIMHAVDVAVTQALESMMMSILNKFSSQEDESTIAPTAPGSGAIN